MLVNDVCLWDYPNFKGATREECDAAWEKIKPSNHQTVKQTQRNRKRDMSNTENTAVINKSIEFLKDEVGWYADMEGTRAERDGLRRGHYDRGAVGRLASRGDVLLQRRRAASRVKDRKTS